jgi:hypothetical protein
MLQHTECGDNSPTFNTPTVSDADLAQMHRDLCDGIRNEAAVTEADLLAMAAAEEPIMPVEWHRQRILQSIRELRQAVQAEIARGKPATPPTSAAC